MNDNNEKNNSGLLLTIIGGDICLLTITFIVLRLCKVISWSWL